MAWSCEAHRAYILDLSDNREKGLFFFKTIGEIECFGNHQTPPNIALRLCAIEQINDKDPVLLSATTYRQVRGRSLTVWSEMKMEGSPLCIRNLPKTGIHNGANHENETDVGDRYRPIAIYRSKRRADR